MDQHDQRGIPRSKSWRTLGSRPRRSRSPTESSLDAPLPTSEGGLGRRLRGSGGDRSASGGLSPLFLRESGCRCVRSGGDAGRSLFQRLGLRCRKPVTAADRRAGLGMPCDGPKAVWPSARKSRRSRVRIALPVPHASDGMPLHGCRRRPTAQLLTVLTVIGAATCDFGLERSHRRPVGVHGVCPRRRVQRVGAHA